MARLRADLPGSKIAEGSGTAIDVRKVFVGSRQHGTVAREGARWVWHRANGGKTSYRPDAMLDDVRAAIARRLRVVVDAVDIRS